MYSKYDEWKSIEDVCFPDWPRHRGERTLADVAKRVIADNNITSGDIVGGVSLGGMVALEIYKILKNPKVVLISSALGHNEISGRLRLLASLASVIPITPIQFLFGISGSGVLKMAASAEPSFIRAMAFAIFSWEGYKGTVVDIIRIHGDADRTIKCPADCFVIPGGTHFTAINRRAECVRIIKEQLKA
ncbi:MAG: alpha/beta hydrolase [Deltaproteobacteria bacterium]|nr:alpha/beta hydrolase [Deltaproteobacteria bacterium]